MKVATKFCEGFTVKLSEPAGLQDFALYWPRLLKDFLKSDPNMKEFTSSGES